MKIKKISLTNFRCYEQLELSLDTRLTILIARNGGGKSSILDAIATCLGSVLTHLPDVKGRSFKDTDLRVTENGKKAPYMRLACISNEDVEWDRTERRDNSKKTQSEIPPAKGVKQLQHYLDQWIDADNADEPYQLPVFIYYGTGRGVFDVPKRKNKWSNAFSRFESFSESLESKTNFRRFVEYFYFLEDKENRLQKEQRSFDVELPELKAIRSAVNKLLPQFSNPRSVSPAGIILDWERNGETCALKIEQLSDGYRTTLAMVMDMAARMAEANPNLEDALQTSGVVLIDEVDLHLHPEWQREFLPKLLKVFPNAQFVVTTHSPFIVQSVQEGSLIDLDHVENVAAAISNLGIEKSIEDITADVMGVEGVQRSAAFQQQVAVAEEYYRLLDEGASEKSSQVDDLAKKLDALEETFADNPAYVAMLRAERRKASNH